MKKKYKLILVAGARPNFMKIAPLMRALENHSMIEPVIVHTGRHYDEEIAGLFQAAPYPGPQYQSAGRLCITCCSDCTYNGTF